MHKIQIVVLLALVAFVPFTSAVADVDMIHVIDVLTDFVKVEDKTIETLLDNNKLSQNNRKDPKMAELVKLLEKISKVDWKAVANYTEVNKFTFDRTLSVDGRIVQMPKMFQLLERIGKINWVTFSALFSSSSSSPRTPRTPRTPPTPSKAEGIDVQIINSRLQRIGRLDWSRM